MMTREEAIELVCYGDWLNILIPHLGDDDINRLAEAMCIIGKALRPVSRERVEKVWRGEWMGSGDGYADGELVYDIWECSHCGYVIDEEDDPDMLPQFCPKCYAAMTDEAVQMVMERLEALFGERNDD